MILNWQDIFALAAVVVSLAYVVRHLCGAGRQSNIAGCGACAGCSGRSRRDVLISIDPPRRSSK